MPCLPSSLLGDFITRLTPRSLVTLLELLFPIPPYCRRPFVVFFRSLFFLSSQFQPKVWSNFLQVEILLGLQVYTSMTRGNSAPQGAEI